MSNPRRHRSCRRKMNWLAAFGVFAVVAGASALVSADDHDERVRLAGDLGGPQFVAAEEVDIASLTTTDLFAAGGEIDAQGLTGDDITMAGGSLRLRGLDIETLKLAGGDVEIQGEVRDHVIAAAGRIELREDARVAGYAVLAGGKLDIDGRIDGNLRAAGGRIRLAGSVGGDVELAGAHITLAPSARIGGKLVYHSRSAARISPDAVVAGGVERRETERFEPSVGAIIGLGIAAWVGFVVALTLLSLLYHAAVPRLVAGATRTVSDRPWPSIGLGIALLVGVPVVANILLFTVVGIPIALLLYTLLGALVASAVVVAGYWTGWSIARLFNWSYDTEGLFRRVLWSLVGFLVLGIVGLIPFLGFLVLAIALALGVGAVMFEIWRATRSWRSASGDVLTT